MIFRKYSSEFKKEIFESKYVITTDEGKEYGIFFRSPIMKYELDAYYLEDEDRNAYYYLDRINNKKRYKILQIILGNKSMVNNINTWAASDDWAGCVINKLTSPIYFSRNYNELTLRPYGANCPLVGGITFIHSKGYHYNNTFCAGHCIKETTIIKIKTKGIDDTEKIIKRKCYHFTYSHIIKEFLDKFNKKGEKN